MVFPMANSDLPLPSYPRFLKLKQAGIFLKGCNQSCEIPFLSLWKWRIEFLFNLFYYYKICHYNLILTVKMAHHNILHHHFDINIIIMRKVSVVIYQTFVLSLLAPRITPWFLSSGKRWESEATRMRICFLASSLWTCVSMHNKHNNIR